MPNHNSPAIAHADHFLNPKGLIDAATSAERLARIQECQDRLTEVIQNQQSALIENRKMVYRESW